MWKNQLLRKNINQMGKKKKSLIEHTSYQWIAFTHKNETVRKNGDEFLQCNKNFEI